MSCSLEINAIYIDTHGQSQGVSCKPVSTSEANDKASVGSSGIGSNSSSIVGNNNLARKRNLSPDAGDVSPETQLDDYEMDKIRRLMVHVDGDRRGCHRGSIEPSLMSTVFAVVLVIIISISVYAFTSLYRAVAKRLNSS